MIIWITGISASGKTTLCRAIRDLVKPALPQLVMLDGDVLRTALGGDLGYREEDRVIQIGRLQGLAKTLSDQGLVVLVAVLYAHPDLLRWNRENLQPYFEVYLKASLDLVRRRDPHRLYAKADAGEMVDVVGLDIPWHAPDCPDLVLGSDDEAPPTEYARRVIDAVPVLANAMHTAAND